MVFYKRIDNLSLKTIKNKLPLHQFGFTLIEINGGINIDKQKP